MPEIKEKPRCANTRANHKKRGLFVFDPSTSEENLPRFASEVNSLPALIDLAGHLIELQEMQSRGRDLR